MIKALRYNEKRYELDGFLVCGPVDLPAYYRWTRNHFLQLEYDEYDVPTIHDENDALHLGVMDLPCLHREEDGGKKAWRLALATGDKVVDILVCMDKDDRDLIEGAGEIIPAIENHPFALRYRKLPPEEVESQRRQHAFDLKRLDLTRQQLKTALKKRGELRCVPFTEDRQSVVQMHIESLREAIRNQETLAEITFAPRTFESEKQFTNELRDTGNRFYEARIRVRTGLEWQATIRIRPLTPEEREQIKARQGDPKPTEPDVAAPAPSAKTETTNAEPEAAPEYVFRRMGDAGDFWQIVFEGRKVDAVQHSDGMTYLHALLSRPQHPFPAYELLCMEHPECRPPPEAVTPPKGSAIAPEDRERYGTGGKPETQITPETRANVNASIAELQAELADLERDEKGQNRPPKYPEFGMEGREECKEAICREIEARQKYLDAAPLYATVEPVEDRKTRQKVCQAIARALNAIVEKNNGGSVAKHLGSTRNGGMVTMGKILSYVGDKPWIT